jgi:tetraacyldisaccharide 4'-kinase
MRELKPTPLTVPLSWIYGVGSALFQGAYDTGLRKPIDLGVPVLSVGNLEVGGTGKTPVVLAMAEAIVESGLVPAILTRGYGGSNIGLLRDGRWESGEAAGREAGDEPLELSRCLPGITIGIGKHRADMGRRILKRQHVDVFLLDDGFQHRRLARQANVLLLDAEKPFGNKLLVPAGPLREPPSAMKRATAILLTGGDAAESTRQRLHGFTGPILTTRLGLDHFETIWGERCVGPESNRPVLVVGGIARPDRLYRFSRALGFDVIGLKSFPDHHLYTKAEVEDLELMAPGAVLMTTAKDAVRLAPFVTNPDRWRVAIVRMQVEEGWSAFLERVLPELMQKKGAATGPLLERDASKL